MTPRTSDVMRAGAVVALLAISAGTAAAAEPAPPVIGADVSSFTLDNGLEVVVIPDHRAPVVTHMVWYKVGSADEPEGKSGIAHFLEHLMFKGTKTHPEGEFSRVVAEIGGDENAFTTTDYTAYFQRVAKENLHLVMSYEADRMQNLILTDENVTPERQVVLEERAMRMESEPGAALGAAMDAVLYLRHPYGIPVIGWREEIEKLGKDDAIAFYDRFYTPNNAILVVAGDVVEADVRAAVADTYAKVARRAEPPVRARPRAVTLEVPRSVSEASAKVNQESVQLSWLAPSYRTAEPGEAEALELLSEAVAGGPTSPLYRDLVIERKLATSVGTSYNSGRYDDGEFSAYAVPREGVSLEDMRQALLDGLKRAVDTGLSDEAVARAKSRLEADTIYAQDSQTALARIFGSTLATGGTVDDVRHWPARIRAVPTAAVKAAAGLLAPERSVTGYLRSAPNGRS
ncbi:M16 family metallopeptidase [Oharaeibacter diazotrophicus]|uniref:Zinc protease n=1 Tax=Oharaeibacter diazotrophicus TaxID=1920512 RepID=A0A4R6RBF6_9HYPH|nr:pitrilysin family protein [Oharaeibacter diazotrophicus]TDP83460.1 zinc protease [Oharaeibacter diazotrophicus]BBE72293.1 peptidase M16 domain protein, pqqF [Pleomorphomonas sp. SM30]